MTMSCKPKKNGHQLSKPVIIANFFECLEEVFDEKNNIRMEMIVKPLLLCR